jgi:thioesterase DpgC
MYARLAIEKFARRFALLLAKLLLLLPDPSELRDGKHADRLEAHSRWGGDAHSSRRWIDTQMDVLDILEHHVHHDAAQITTETAAAATLLAAGRESRECFLEAHAAQVYDALTIRRTCLLQVDALLARAAIVYPGLVPSDATLAAEAGLRQGDKDGHEIDQGIFLAHILAGRETGTLLCHAMLLPRPDAPGIAAEFAARETLDLGAVRLERWDEAVVLTTTNPRFLNAEDDTTQDAMELAVDVALLDPNSKAAVLRGDLAKHPKYEGRRVFGSGINLTRLYHGKIPFLWFIKRDLGWVNKLLRGLAEPGIAPDTHNRDRLEKPWIAAVESFAIGGHCQMLLCMDYVLATPEARLTLPARREGIIPGMANLRLPRFTGFRLARQAIQHGYELRCDSSEGRTICDEVVRPSDMERTIRNLVADLTRRGRLGYSANRRSLRIGAEPLELFRSYFASYVRDQAYCVFGAELTENLEQHWNAQKRAP